MASRERSEFPISEAAVEAAAKAIHAELDAVDLLDGVDEDVSAEVATNSARAAIEAFLQTEAELGWPCLREDE